jgi:hypothetical protein
VDSAALAKLAGVVARMCELPEDIPMARDRYGNPDIGIFDFTKKQSVVHPAKLFECKGVRLLVAMVGDALIAPFWPQVQASFDPSHCPPQTPCTPTVTPPPAPFNPPALPL